MSKLTKSVLVVAFAFALVASASSASAATVEELQAMIAQLQAQIAALLGQSTGGAANCGFTRDLTIGSTGSDVTCLQNYLTGKGFFNFAGGSTGYFGSITKSAVAAWQAANGITPPAGYFGPLSRGAYNSMVGTGGTTGGGTTGGTTGGTGITTPGAEGTLTVSKNPTPSSGITRYEGDSRVAVLGLKVEAKNSDLAVQRVKLSLGTNSSFYTKVFSRVYVMDGSTVLAQMDLNSSTVYEEGNTKYVQITGFNWVVPKDSTKVLTIAADLYSNIDSSGSGTCDSTGDTGCTWTLPANGVRAIDGAGIDQQGPSSALSNSVTLAATLVDSASLVLSLNTGTPDTREIIAAQGSTEDEYDQLELGMIDLKAEKDTLLLTDFTATITATGSGTATVTTGYLYDGSTLVGTAAVTGNGLYMIFDDIDYTLPKDTTKTFTIKGDVRDATNAATTFTVSATSTSPTVENSEGSSVTPSGSATANGVTVRNVGAEFTLLSKTIEKSSTPINNNISTSTAKGTFTLRIKAVGGDVMLGTVASTSPALGSSTTFFKAYVNGAASTLLVSSSTSYTTPGTGVVTSGLTNSFTLQEGNTIDLPVSFQFEGRTAASTLVSTGAYSIGLEQVNWVSSGGAQSSTFMAGKTSWRTSEVSMP